MPTPPVVSPAEQVPAADPALGSMIQINEFNDLTRTSMVQVIQPDGRRRVVVRTPSQEPVTPLREEVRSRTVPLSELEITSVQASSATVTEMVGAADRALSSEKAQITATAGDQDLVRRQVGDALRDVAQALARLAESLDPR
ncbi:hypothetical protein [Gordonia hirsuta]|uniref:hypothetical protein n=1 Tax=Gordonia hirsuta TaxID=53427 RepID=UPI00138AC175|nr:hypothetical protein [Gordonia hirsuta]